MKIKLIFLGLFVLLNSCASDFRSAGLPSTPFRVHGRGFSVSGNLGGTQKKAPQKNYYASSSSSTSATRASRPRTTSGSSQPSANEQFAMGLFNAMVFGGGGSSGGSDSASGYQNGAAGWAAQKGQ